MSFWHIVFDCCLVNLKVEISFCRFSTCLDDFLDSAIWFMAWAFWMNELCWGFLLLVKKWVVRFFSSKGGVIPSGSFDPADRRHIVVRPPRKEPNCKCTPLRLRHGFSIEGSWGNKFEVHKTFQKTIGKIWNSPAWWPYGCNCDMLFFFLNHAKATISDVEPWRHHGILHEFVP